MSHIENGAIKLAIVVPIGAALGLAGVSVGTPHDRARAARTSTLTVCQRETFHVDH